MKDEINQGPICHRKPEISYPCDWEYKVIGLDRVKLEQVIAAACAPAIPAVALSNVSSGGRYFSLNVTLRVEDEAMRLAIFKKLQDHPEVKMVI
jgi:putative lipoic acid-binding regulatory protein